MPRPPLPNWTEIADLEVQRRLAHVAEVMLQLTYAQIVLGILGTIALIFTLRETRKSTSAALAAVQAQRAAERAVLVISEAKAEVHQLTYSEARSYHDDVKEARIFKGVIVLKNSGATVALVKKRIAKAVFDVCLPDDPEEYSDELVEFQHVPVSSGNDIRIVASNLDILSGSDLEDWKNNIKRMWVMGFVEYEDIFGGVHWQGFCYKFGRIGALEEAGGPKYWSKESRKKARR